MMTLYFFALMGMIAFCDGLLVDDPVVSAQILLACILMTIGGVLVCKPWEKLGTQKKEK